MKFFLRFFAVAALAFTGSALDAQVLFYEDFDGIPGPTAGGAGTYAFPAGWYLRNVDNGTPAASVSYVNEAWERREDFSFSVVDSAAFSTSWYNPVGLANDFMWTPLIGPIPANTVLTWNAVTYDASYPDGYEVRIMTSASGPPTGGTGVIGNQITNSTSVFSIAAENTTWTARSLSLSAYAGQSIYIGYRNNSNNQFLLLIDDIKVEVQAPNEARMLYLDTISQYTQMPVTQTTPLTFNGIINNFGINNLSNVYAEVNTYNGASLVNTINSGTTATLTPAANASWSATGYTPNAVGTHTVKAVAKHSVTDINPLNDTLSSSIEVTDSVYARDNSTVTGSIGIGAGVVGYVGQSFTVPNPNPLTSVSFYVTRGYTGRRAAAVLWNTLGNGTPNTIIASTDTMLYPDDSARFYTLPLSGGPLSLASGSYVITMVEFDSTLALGQTMDIFTPNTTWVNWPGSPFGTWANMEDFGSAFARASVLRLNFGDVCANNTATATSTDATCATCPDGTASVTTSGTDGNVTYAWSPSGGNAATATGLLPGTYIVTTTDVFGCSTSDTVTVGFDPCTTFSGSMTSMMASCATCPDGTATVTISGGSGNETYSWSNGGTTSTITNLLPGTYTVTVVDSANGCSYSDTVVVNFSTSLGEITGLTNAGVYPNPNEGSFNLFVSFEQATDMDVILYNTLGQAVYTKRYPAQLKSNILIDQPLTPGLYSLVIRTETGLKTIPVTVKEK